MTSDNDVASGEVCDDQAAKHRRVSLPCRHVASYGDSTLVSAANMTVCGEGCHATNHTEAAKRSNAESGDGNDVDGRGGRRSPLTVNGEVTFRGVTNRVGRSASAARGPYGRTAKQEDAHQVGSMVKHARRALPCCQLLEGGESRSRSLLPDDERRILQGDQTIPGGGYPVFG